MMTMGLCGCVKIDDAYTDYIKKVSVNILSPFLTFIYNNCFQTAL